MYVPNLEEIGQRVAKGAAYLDENLPDGWRSRVDREHLEAGCPVHSILGQLIGPNPVEWFAFIGHGDAADEDGASTAGAAEELCSYGFAIMVKTRVRVPDFVYETAVQFTRSMGLLPEDYEITPDQEEFLRYHDMPRPEGEVRMEAAALEHCWRRVLADA